MKVDIKPKIKMEKGEAKQNIVKEFTSLRKAADAKGVPLNDIRSIFLDSVQTDVKNGNLKRDKKSINGHLKGGTEIRRKQGRISKGQILKKYIFPVIFVLGLLSSVAVLYYEVPFDEILEEIESSRCLVENTHDTMEIFRPLVNCDLCRTLNRVPIEYNISAQDFKRKYAYSSVPVLIKDATQNWSAMSNFSFHFFKDLYTGMEGALEEVDKECQFFPYKTDFATLSEVFNMSDERANFTEGEIPWYIGWSNCHPEVKNELRNHYERPYFLPSDSESSSLDWIFMGGSGPGAHIHLDYVQRPSWQAQISGMKTWTLIPSPECEDKCKDLNVTVNKGDIFVVDTNNWYHSTFVHPGDISITIGSEYD